MKWFIALVAALVAFPAFAGEKVIEGCNPCVVADAEVCVDGTCTPSVCGPNGCPTLADPATCIDGNCLARTCGTVAVNPGPERSILVSDGEKKDRFWIKLRSAPRKFMVRLFSGVQERRAHRQSRRGH